MSILFLLFLASLMISGGFLIAFLYQSQHGQFDDLSSPSQKILIDDDVISDSPTT